MERILSSYEPQETNADQYVIITHFCIYYYYIPYIPRMYISC